MATGLDVVTDAMEMIGVAAPGEDLEAADANRGLIRLNNMIDSFNNESLTCFAIFEQSMLLLPGQNQYTIGPGGYVNGPRPIRLVYGPGCGYLLDPNHNRYPITVLPRDQWNQIWNLILTTSNLPNTLFYDPQFPLGQLNVWPMPNIGGMTMYFDSYQQLSAFPDLFTDITFPPGYELMLKTNLAVHLKPYFREAQIDPDLRMQADESKGNVKRANIRQNLAVFDPELSRSMGRPYNVYSDTHR